MKKSRIKAIVIALFAASVLGACTACGTDSGGKFVVMHSPEDELRGVPEDGYIDISLEMVPLSAAPAMFAAFPTPVASGTEVKKNDKAIIDMSNTEDGYIMVKYLVKTDKALRVRVTGPSGEVYTYTLKSNGEYEVYPLSDGNGEYQIAVYENVKGTSYATSNSAKVTVKMKDEFAPFIRPNQYVNFKEDSEVVKKAEELTKDKKTMLDKIAAVYDFVVTNFSYDAELAATVQAGYLPDVDKALEKKKGICFDYAAVMSAMFRSQGIPTKLVIGHATTPQGSVYHAWINTYSEETGWVDSVIFFDGKEWKLMDPTFASSSNRSEAIMKLIGDGKNYTAKYLY